jgi:ABC-type bacteriocin/lantibiotic exporter with double-glycine peptidase domain
MDILINIVISGLSVAYIVEFITAFTNRFIPSWILKAILPFPFSVISLYVLGIFGLPLIIYGLAASCIALVVVFFVNRPVTNQVINTRR